VVEHWIGQLAAKAGLSWQRDEQLDILAVRWATGRGNRNGRCAYQFARYWVG
jgi:predicted AAA+ superfamily ATPase